MIRNSAMASMLGRVATMTVVMSSALVASHAAEPQPVPTKPDAQTALKTLLESQVGRADPGLREVSVASGTAPALGSGGRTVVNVARGQSLDALLRQHLAASPLRVEVLRELTRQLNPQAFASGPGFRLQAGARLQLPTPQDQAQHAFGKVLATSDSVQDRGVHERSGTGGGSVEAARKGWVRYP